MPNYNVIIVEDDSMMSFIHKSLVKKHNLSSNPLTFPNGKKALDYLEQDSAEEDYFMVLLDLNMPVMDGWSFLDEISKKRVVNRTIVVVVTSSVDQTDRNRAKKYDVVYSYQTKPLVTFTPLFEGMEELKKLS